MAKRKSILTLFILVIFSILLCCISYFGIGENKLLGIQNIKQGLDLKGGVNVVYEAIDGIPSEEDMKIALSVIQARLDRKNYNEAEVSKQGTNRIRVDIPGIDNSEQAVETIGKTAKLSFRDEEGNELLSGRHVKTAAQAVNKDATGISEVVVTLDFNSEGAVLFEEATSKNIGKTISIFLDEELLTSARVDRSISGGKAQIQGGANGGFSIETATELATLIQDGALPFELEVVSLTNVGARLGVSSLNTSIIAGAVGFALILLLMIVLYKVSGLAADLALFIYLGLELIFLSLFGITLTLPGIAGIVLSVGMAVDANIIIFERIKDELKSGKSLRLSNETGFKRAFPAILDSNVTTIIAGVILYWLGTGPIKGFAQTLVIGILISMFTATVITRFILKSLIDSGLNNPKLYGGK